MNKMQALIMPFDVCFISYESEAHTHTHTAAMACVFKSEMFAVRICMYDIHTHTFALQ